MSRSYSDTCPGIRKFIRPTPEYIKCPNCGGTVEIWSDEHNTICETCNSKCAREEKAKSCLEWCEFADKCKEIIKQKKRQRSIREPS